jgi:hypothetical protein
MFNCSNTLFMKKMKVFFTAAALVLVTAAVFAGKSKFADVYELRYLTGSNYVDISTTGFAPVSPLKLTGTTQAEIVGAAGTFDLFYYDVTTSTPFKVYF